MPKTKPTDRKVPSVVCPSCKKAYDGEFKRHLEEFSKQRFDHQSCGASNKKPSYDNKHIKRNNPNGEIQKDKKLEKKAIGKEVKQIDRKDQCENTDIYDFTDYAPDQDIDTLVNEDMNEESKNVKPEETQIELETQKKKENDSIIADKRVVNDVRTERMIRKRTASAEPVQTLVKGKSLEESPPRSKKVRFDVTETVKLNVKDNKIQEQRQVEASTSTDKYESFRNDNEFERARLQLEGRKVELEFAKIESLERQRREEREYKKNMVEMILSIINKT